MTQAQKVASNPTHSVYVSASAGSGKTKVLTDRVLRILLGGTAPGKIMCLTFTNAAAAEMANRINKNLMKWAIASDDELYKNIYDLTSVTPDQKTMELARRLFVEVLDTPDGLKIQTIHAFCQNLMRRFPLEAGIAPHFTVIDEQTSLELLKEARMRLFSESDQHSENVRAAISNIAWRLHDGSFTSLLLEITKEREKIENLLSKYSPPEIVAKIYEALGVMEGQTAEAVLQAAYGGDNADLVMACRALLEGSSGDIGRGETMAEFLEKINVDAGRGIHPFRMFIPSENGPRHEHEEGVNTPSCISLAEAFEVYKTAFLTKEDEPRKTLATGAIIKKDPKVGEILEREQTRILELNDKLKSILIARLTEDLFHIGEAILALYKKSKNTKAFLDYNDLIIAAKKLLYKPDIAPWILYKLDGGIDHLLVDEAQDTSPEQWRIIEALCEEFFTGDSAVNKNRTIFIVGDEKQSIFSFQGADPKVFHKMQEVFSARTENVKKGWENVSLDMSFRSTSPVLACVDAIFSAEKIKSAITFKPDYTNHIAHRSQHAGRVEIWPLIEKDETEEFQPWHVHLNRLQPNNQKKKLAEQIASTIKNWLDEGRKITARGRKIVPGDIMILVRKRDTLVDYLVRGLKSRGVAVAGVDRMVLTDHIVVMDLIALGEFLLLPQDDLNLAVVLKSPLIGFSEDDLFALAHGRGEMSLWERLRELANEEAGHEYGEGVNTLSRSRSAYDYLITLLNKTDFISLFSLYSYVLEALGGRKQFAARLGLEINDPLDEFLSLALDYERTHPPSLQGFLHWLSVGKAEVKRDLDQGNNEVRIMTVHGSKGLQAPIVFLPDTTGMPSHKTNNIFWKEDGADPVMLWNVRSSHMNNLCRDLRDAQKETANNEYLRLLYVALTRAEDELYIAGAKGDSKIHDDCWYNVIKNGIEKLAQKDGDILYIESEQSETVSNDNEMAEATDLNIELPDFIHAPAPIEPSPSIPLAPSQMKENNPPVQSPLMGKSVLRGKLIHKLLEYLPDIESEKRAIVAAQFMGKHSNELSGEEQQDIIDSVFKVLNNEQISHIFGTGSKAEVPIAGVIGKYVVVGQIDRLLITEKEVLVVDYKTNRTPPKNAADVHINYLKQMAAYKAALKQIYPEKAIRCALVWTEEPSVMVLGGEVLDGVGL
jgi:ATP-dependent helicase/nuclease subunit A